MKLIQNINAWLEHPNTSDLNKAVETTHEFVVSAVALMKANPEHNAELGPLVGKLKSLQKQLTDVELVNWTEIKEGSLALGHRPSAKLVSDLKLQGGTHLFTLLSESEEALKYKAFAEKSGMGWIWFPMTSAQAPSETRSAELKAVFDELSAALKNKGKIYVHCSAGIHRTGMISYTFLRHLGYSEGQTEELLALLRSETAEGVGAHRKQWGEKLLQVIK